METRLYIWNCLGPGPASKNVMCHAIAILRDWVSKSKPTGQVSSESQKLQRIAYTGKYTLRSQCKHILVCNVVTVGSLWIGFQRAFEIILLPNNFFPKAPLSIKQWSASRKDYFPPSDLEEPPVNALMSHWLLGPLRVMDLYGCLSI